MAKFSGAVVGTSVFLFFSGVLFAFLAGQAAATAADDDAFEKTVFSLVNEAIYNWQLQRRPQPHPFAVP
ncbi:hypothetical protein ACP70R_041212 [Stipagrostis hirtigluma subsp. patula]